MPADAPDYSRAFPHLPRAWWECPCAKEKSRWSTTTTVFVRISLMPPDCPWCGRMFREEYRVVPGVAPAPKPLPVKRKRRSSPPGQMSLFEELA